MSRCTRESKAAMRVALPRVVLERALAVGVALVPLERVDVLVERRRVDLIRNAARDVLGDEGEDVGRRVLANHWSLLVPEQHVVVGSSCTSKQMLVTKMIQWICIS